jgi:hypothetical protein
MGSSALTLIKPGVNGRPKELTPVINQEGQLFILCFTSRESGQMQPAAERRRR